MTLNHPLTRRAALQGIAAWAGVARLAHAAEPSADGRLVETPPPARIFFDTDMDSDCDDAGALALLHALADRGEAEILAVAASSLYRWSVPCIEVINRYYGRPDLPLGAPKRDAVDSHAGSKYARAIAESTATRWKTNADAPDATEVYRQTLASQPDGSAIIVSVGDVTNIRNLLRSGPDTHSPLAGPDLVRCKVIRWVCMGGRYPSHLDPRVFGNFKTDPAATVAAARDWPIEVVFSGLGDNILTGLRLNQTPPENPVRRAYELYLAKQPARPSWDPIAVLYAVRPKAPFWRRRTEGHNHILPNGTNQWRSEPDSSNHVLLELVPGADEEVGRTIDELIIQPPRHPGP
jgi:inosine-uridine nucleoside N-ribohydrolase